MCNHYRNDPVARQSLATWREYIGYDLASHNPEVPTDAWPKRLALVVRNAGETKVPDVMTWGVPLTVPSKRPGTTISKHVTNVRNL
jgi:hypothetical protein